MADVEFKIYEVSLSILAASTSALAEIIVAAATRFCTAAACKLVRTC